MRVLAIESSGRTGSIALVDASGATPQLIVEQTTVEAARTAQSLVPTMKAALNEAGWKPTDVDLVCVTVGPGSFTGLRIGVVAAKTFAYAVGAKLVGVHTLAALAAGVDRKYRRLWAVLDAQRQELFAACFDESTSLVAAAGPRTEIVTLPAIIERLQTGDAIAGPPLAKLRQQLPSSVNILDDRIWQPQARAVAVMGLAVLRSGAQSSPIELVPRYYRKSAAEEKADKSNA